VRLGDPCRSGIRMSRDGGSTVEKREKERRRGPPLIRSAGLNLWRERGPGDVSTSATRLVQPRCRTHARTNGRTGPCNSNRTQENRTNFPQRTAAVGKARTNFAYVELVGKATKDWGWRGDSPKAEFAPRCVPVVAPSTLSARLRLTSIALHESLAHTSLGGFTAIPIHAPRRIEIHLIHLRSHFIHWT
jgi:hypothetical protein